jgi:hypothetical protein
MKLKDVLKWVVDKVSSIDIRNVLRLVVDKVSLYLDPFLYVKNKQELYANQLDFNIAEHIIPKLNALDEKIIKRIHPEGKDKFEFKDFNFDFLEKVLLPKNNINSVFRVNHPINESRVSQVYKVRNSEIDKDGWVAPRTITLFSSAVKAKDACKVLEILTEGTCADICYEKIIEDEKTFYTVSDNMTLETHNTLRALSKHLARRDLTKEEIGERQKEIQERVNSRLTGAELAKGWHAWRGITTFLTLAGRPGVKKFNEYESKGENGHRGKKEYDELDAFYLSLIREQNKPEFMRDCIEAPGIAKDGRIHDPVESTKGSYEKFLLKIFKEKPDNAILYSHVGRAVLGDKTYSILARGDKKVIGELKEGILKPTIDKASSVYEIISDVVKGNFQGALITAASGLIGVGVSVLHMSSTALYSGAMGICDGISQTYCKLDSSKTPYNFNFISWAQKQLEDDKFSFSGEHLKPSVEHVEASSAYCTISECIKR